MQAHQGGCERAWHREGQRINIQFEMYGLPTAAIWYRKLDDLN